MNIPTTTLYDAAGNRFTVNSADVDEHVAAGLLRERPKSAVEAEKAAAAKADAEAKAAAEKAEADRKRAEKAAAAKG